MPLYVCGPSALNYYRNAFAPADADEENNSLLCLPDALYRWDDITHTSTGVLCAEEWSHENPLHVMVPCAKQRSTIPAVSYSVYGKPLPKGSIRRANPEVYVCSPEFLFVQLARVLDPAELIALGMELCGTYRQNVAGINEHGRPVTTTTYDCLQLTTHKKLEAYLKRASFLPGSKPASAALKHVLDLSASPLETDTYLFLCLPRRMGGYALSVPELNPSITISERGKSFTFRKSARGDLYWRTAKLDLECLGSTHEDSRTEDSMRRKALERMGTEVIELTYDEVCSAEIFHATALRIARSLGEKVRVYRDFAQRRDQLRATLLHSPHGLWDASESSLEPSAFASDSDEYPVEEEYWSEDEYFNEADVTIESWDDGSFAEDQAQVWDDEPAMDDSDGSEGWETEF